MAWRWVGRELGWLGRGSVTCDLKGEWESAFQTGPKGRGTRNEGGTCWVNAVWQLGLWESYTHLPLQPWQQLCKADTVTAPSLCQVRQLNRVNRLGNVQRSHSLQDSMWAAIKGYVGCFCQRENIGIIFLHQGVLYFSSDTNWVL